jgi:L-fucose isomerase-like protein
MKSTVVKAINLSSGVEAPIRPNKQRHQELQGTPSATSQSNLRRAAESKKKSRFALFFGNRGFFPSSLMAGARKEMQEVLTGMGHETLIMEANATRFGAVETAAEGRRYAAFLEQNRGKYDGVILCLPNFGDENGAAEALKAANVPILIQAYPDEMNKLAAKYRRDSFCGKISIMDVFCQQGIKFTALKPHVVDPRSPRFARNVDYFDRVCRTVAGMKNLRVGMLGARTTAFKTVRIDELTLQRSGVTVETYDISSIIEEVRALNPNDSRCKAKLEFLRGYSTWAGVPEECFLNIAKLGTVLDGIIERDRLNSIALRCWIEFQKQLRISPCVLMSDFNDRGIAAACETDIGSAVTMQALSLATGNAPACLDWNNNFNEDDDKCIVFHCGPTPQAMMLEKGQIEDHQILANVVGPGCAFGCNVGRLKPSPMTYGNLMSENGRLRMYLGEGEFTPDPVPREFFGTAGVVKIENLQDVLLTIGNEGFRHHVSIAHGTVKEPLAEAMEKYLGYEVLRF